MPAQAPVAGALTRASAASNRSDGRITASAFAGSGR